MTSKRTILIVEDEDIIRNSLSELLTGEGYQVSEAGRVGDAVDLAKETDFDVAICDVQLPDGDGLALLRKLHQRNPHTCILIITAYATVENAVEAFKAGAFDYLVKPVLFEDLLHKLDRLYEFRNLYFENQSLRRELDRQGDLNQIVGSSRAIAAVQLQIRKVAVTNANVLLVGETGTGKELFARAIHAAGPNSSDQFLAVNCSTQPVELLESQLFGTRDAGDGNRAEPGVLRHAGKGTVFLDEIGDLPLSTQAKLLRAIEYGEILPVGGSETQKVEARIVASTTRELAQEVAKEHFHEDLFYRLDGVKIQIPPLRDRIDDIPELVEFFVTKYSKQMKKRVAGASSETIRLLTGAEWKGNVRQLDNAIERAVMMSDSKTIGPTDLPPDILGMGNPLPDTEELRSALRHYERLHITRVLRQWPDKREAARRLKLGLSSLYRKIEELRIDVESIK
ncbi:MAG: sigma-54 dependent transcriptional regulator [Planctomycetota bacterium]|nr:sigma-54 dependent transcriptional regulator [Planctomycetota bacterium]MDA1251030.1 sigma-54 dependent transcriptional regulator [Planctomycetota bacterium]